MRFYSTILLLLLVRFGCAQPNKTYTFKYLPAEKFGLNEVSSQQWDKSGRIWMVTDKGFAVYDGYATRAWTFNPNSKQFLLSKSIRTVLLDSKDQLWIAYADRTGISKFDVNDEKFTHYLPDSTSKQAIPDAVVTRFLEDQQGRFWLCYWGGGISQLNRKTGVFENYRANSAEPNNRHNIPLDIVKGIAQIDTHRFLLGFFSEGNPLAKPVVFDASTNTFSPFPLSDYLAKVDVKEQYMINLALTIVNFIHFDKNKNIWFGTYCGMVFFDTKNKTCKRVSGHEFDNTMLNLDNARSCVEDANGMLWIATPNKGVLNINTNTQKGFYLQHDPGRINSMSDNRINSLRVDGDNNVWVSTGSGGVSIYNPMLHQFQILEWSGMALDYTYQSEQSVPVNQMLVLNKNNIYISSENGITIYNPEEDKIDGKIEQWDTYKTKEGSVTTRRIENFKPVNNTEMLFTKGRQLFLYNNKSKQFKQIHEKKDSLFKLSGILFRHHSKKDKFYTFGVYPGQIHEYNSKTGEIGQIALIKRNLPKDFDGAVKLTERFSTVLPSGKWLISALEGRYGLPYVNRFLIFDPNTKEQVLYGPKNSDKYFPDSTITNVFVDSKKRIWITTENGFYQFNEQTGKAVYMNKALHLNTIPVRAIIEDNTGMFWLASDKYLMRWNGLDHKTFVYDERLGLPAGTFLPSVAQKDENGNIYIATYNGILMFDPSKLNFPSQKPVVMLTRLSIREDTLIQNELRAFIKGDATLSWNRNFLSMDFATNQAYSLGSHTFYYRLLGLDSVWQNNQTSNQIRYTNLAPGKYILEVKVKNVYKVDSEVLKIPFTIQKPFWKTWWFYLLCIALAATLLYAYIKYREKALKRQQEILEHKVAERTAEVVEKAKQITLQKEIIEEKNKELTDSIHYAQRIQHAILPDEKALIANFKDYFVLFKPKDIVSGDFYWFSQHDENIIWAVVDCTGHGVPGGFMSMLGSGILNQIVNEEKKFSPDVILNELRDRVILALKQTGTIGENRDGMDISLFRWMKRAGKIEFAGANNSGYVLRKEEIVELKADKQPIGIYVGEKKPFTLTTIDVVNGDMLYMTSDGYADQFGGPKGKKFKTANLEKLMLEIQHNSCITQRTTLEKTFMTWKGDYEQLDDVCLFGVRV